MFSTMFNIVNQEYSFTSIFNALNNYLSLFTNTFCIYTSLFFSLQPLYVLIFHRINQDIKKHEFIQIKKCYLINLDSISYLNTLPIPIIHPIKIIEICNNTFQLTQSQHSMFPHIKKKHIFHYQNEFS